MADKTDIKARIVGHQGRIAHKFQKLRQNHINLWRWKYHGVIDARKLFDVKGNRHIRIYETGKTVCDYTIHYLYCTDLNDPVF